MVGKILRVEKVGDQVEEDEVVVVMEAMKMEIPVVAPANGVLRTESYPGSGRRGGTSSRCH